MLFAARLEALGDCALGCNLFGWFFSHDCFCPFLFFSLRHVDVVVVDVPPTFPS